MYVTQKTDACAEIVPNGKRPFFNQSRSLQELLVMQVRYYMENWTPSHGPVETMGWGWHWKNV